MSPFNLNTTDLENLGADRAVEYSRRLLWAEATRTKVGIHLIDIPQCINVGDGGLDAYIENASPENDELIPAGDSGFQIKSSDLSPEECKKELHVSGDLNKPLKPGILKLLQKNGTYVLILFADITSNSKLFLKRESAINEELKKCGYANAKVRIYTINQLIGFTERYPSLVTWFKNDFRNCLPYKIWGQNQDVKHPANFVLNEERTRIIENERQQIRTNKVDSLIYRVNALPGQGKTRLIYELLSPEDLQNQVMYVSAEQLLNNNILFELQNNNGINAILVVDDCNLEQHNFITNALAGHGARITVFTLSYEFGSAPPPTRYIKFNPLQLETIKEIIKVNYPEIANRTTIVDRISQFADGYPRIACLLSESYAKSRDDGNEFITLSDDGLVNRLICGKEPVNSQHFKNTKKVLMGLSIFTKVGYKKNIFKESEWLAEYFQIDMMTFKTIIEEQRNRGTVQGDYYIMITPFMLRVALLREWWGLNAFDSEKFNKFIQTIPEDFRADMLKRFSEQVPYISSVEQGQDFIKDLLSEQGIFGDENFLDTDLGADFFLNLSEANPEAALAYLEHTIGKWNKDRLGKFNKGRRNVIWALEKIVIWNDLFVRGARILLKLAEAENEKISNNATGVFADLFSLGYDQLAPTEAPPSKRFIVLKEAIDSDSKDLRLIAIKACDKGLESQFFTKDIGPEYQGLRKIPILWKPKTYRELYDAYRFMWTLLYDKLDTFQDNERKEAIDVLLKRSTGLARIASLAEMVVNSLANLASKENIPNKEELLRSITWIINNNEGFLKENLINKLKNVYQNAVGTDFKSSLSWYLGHNPLAIGDTDWKKQDDLKQTTISNYAKELLADINQFNKCLNWLLTDEVTNIHLFGYEIAKQDMHFSVLPLILDEYTNNSFQRGINFLTGYLGYVFDIKPDTWEESIKKLLDFDKTNIVRIISGSGLNDAMLTTIMSRMKAGDLPKEDLRFFYYSRHLENLSDEKFQDLIDYMAESNNMSLIAAALNYLNNYYLFKKKHTLPQQPTLKLISHPLLFNSQEVRRYNDMIEYDWQEILKEFLKKYPNDTIPIGEKMLEYFGVDGNIVGSFYSKQKEILIEIALHSPVRIWESVTKYLGPPIDKRAFDLRTWLRGTISFSKSDKGALSIFPADLIWKWIEEDIDKRAWYVSNFVPPYLFHGTTEVCLAREILVRYGKREDVRNELSANFSSEGWTGPASLHYREKINMLNDFRENETNKNVLVWLNEYISSLERYYEREKIEEERECR